MGRGRVFTEPTVWENRLMDLINNGISDAPTEIVGKLLTVSCEYDVVLGMPSEIPRWKEGTGDQAFSMARRKEDHESRDFTSLDSLQLGHN
jgi:hypothetical protein